MPTTVPFRSIATSLALLLTTWAAAGVSGSAFGQDREVPERPAPLPPPDLTAPIDPDPHLSLPPQPRPRADYEAFRRRGAIRVAERMASRALTRAAAEVPSVAESESAVGENDVQSDAEHLAGFRYRGSGEPAVQVEGRLIGPEEQDADPIDDVDYYSFELEAGDILSARVLAGSGKLLRVWLPDGEEAIGSASDPSFLYPLITPLLLGGQANLAHVTSVTGRYAISVSGTAGDAGDDYTLDLRIFRPVSDGKVQKQTLFLDFDGATVNANVFAPGAGIRTLSPLSAFLESFDLAPEDETALIDRIVAITRENLESDMEFLGLSTHYQIEILDSAHHADPFPGDDASRVIVGGSIAESGINTVGIAETIDVGNFATQETALVLLDVLATTATSLPRAADVSPLEVAARGIANIVSHEAGHLFGCYHTTNANSELNLMDEGGLIPPYFEVGLDGIFGTADDAPMDFGTDIFSTLEGFTGTEDTLNVIAFALEADRSRPPGRPVVQRLNASPILSGARGAQIRALGDGYTPLSIAFLDGVPLEPRFANRRRAHLPVPTEFTAEPGFLRLRMYTPGPGGGLSRPGYVRVIESRALAQEDFEAGEAGFTALAGDTLTWQLTTNRGDDSGHSPQTSFYFGDPGSFTYDTGAAESGALLSPAVTLGAATPIELSFTYYLETERTPPYDRAEVLISTDGFATGQVLAANHSGGLVDGSGAFQRITIDLSRFAGETVGLAFIFSTVDSTANDFEGWYVDDVTLMEPAD